MQIEVDLSPALERLLGQPADLVRRAGLLGAKRAAEDYVEAIRDWIAAGRSFTPRTGRIENELGWRPTGEGAEVYSNAPYAAFVERGTKPHRIAPRPGRQALRWFPAGGGTAFARAVLHPGTKPLPFFYADRAQREHAMLEAMRATVAEVLTP